MTQKAINELVDAVALKLAAAYWRGRLREAIETGDMKEVAINALAEKAKPQWMDSAKVALSAILEKGEMK